MQNGQIKHKKKNNPGLTQLQTTEFFKTTEALASNKTTASFFSFFL